MQEYRKISRSPKFHNRVRKSSLLRRQTSLANKAPPYLSKFHFVIINPHMFWLFKVTVLFQSTTEARRSVLLSDTRLRPLTGFLLPSDICGFLHVGRLLRREGGSVVSNRHWASSAQSFSDPSPTGVMTRFYMVCGRHVTSGQT
jgi:hypothetical protein